MDDKHYAIGYNPVGHLRDVHYFTNVFTSFADADYFIRNMRRSVKNFHYFVEACEVKECVKCKGSGIVRASYNIYDHELEACENCHGHGVVKA